MLVKKMSEIISGLYLGDEEDAFDQRLSSGLTVVNIAAEAKQTPYANRYFHIPANDVPTEQLDKYFPYAIQIIEDELTRGNKVLVHCLAGISRSATIVIAYLMWKYRWSFPTAYEYVKTKRPIIDPNFGFISQLYVYGKDILGVE